MIITLDGPAGTGKSTIAKKLSEKLHFYHFDSGALYRAITWYVLEKKINIHDEKALEEGVKDFHVDIQVNDHQEKRYIVENQDISKEIRQNRISNTVSLISSKKFVREKLMPIQRGFAKNRNVVYEGRDMGSVIFPHADLKIFLTADVHIRAERRQKQLQEANMQVPPLNELLKEIEERDRLDSTRHLSPLVCPKDAFVIDTSKMTIEEVIQAIMDKMPQKKYVRHYKSWLYAFIIAASRNFYKLFYHHKQFGLKHFFSGKGILVCNHLSNLDPPAVAISCPEEIHFLAKKSLFNVFFLGWLIRKVHAHPVSRGAFDPATVREIEELLQKGQKILLFPEGTRSLTGERGKIKSGAAFLAYNTQTDILPACVYGTDVIWPPSKKIFKLSGQTICAFGSPIRIQEYLKMEKKEAIEAINQRIEKSFEELYNWIDKGCIGIPP
jgi:cytidylate kinase